MKFRRIRYGTFQMPYPHKDVERVIDDYRAAQEIIGKQVERAIADDRIGERAFRRRAMLAIDNELRALGAQTDPKLRALIDKAFRASDAAVMAALPETRGSLLGMGFDALNRDAIEEMQKALVDRMAEAMRTVGRRVNDVYREAGLRSVQETLMGAHGSTPKAAAALRDRLAKQGVTGFVDRAGRAWDMKNYTEMVVRTTTAEAVIAAETNRFAEQGVFAARISTSPSACQLCKPYEGTLVTFDEAIGDIDGEDATFVGNLPNGGLPLHPRCTHAYLPEAMDFDSFAASQYADDLEAVEF